MISLCIVNKPEASSNTTANATWKSQKKKECLVHPIRQRSSHTHTQTNLFFFFAKKKTSENRIKTLIIHCRENLLLDGVLEGEETRAVRQQVVAGSRLGVTSLVQELEVARVDGEGLVGVGADKVTVGNVVGPGGARVGLAGKGAALGSGLRSPGAAEGGGGEGTEVAAVGALGLDDHEVLGLALEGVDLDGLEQVVGGVAHGDGAGAAEAAGEVANGHAGAVDLAVVAGEEQVHVLAITDDGLVNRTSAGTRDGASEQRLSSRPAVSVAGILRGAV